MTSLSFSRRRGFLAASVVVGLVVACGACSGGAGGNCPVFTASCLPGYVPTDTDGDGCVDQCRPAPSDAGEGGTSDGGASCTIAADCGPDAVCGFSNGAACTATGACFSTKGVATCAAYSAGCACDGTTINVACAPVPSGYTTKPILHAGDCTTADQDAGAACATDAECGSMGVCGFPTADACTAKGTCFPKTGVTCNAFLPGCACDGTTVNLACNYLPSTHAPKPLRHSGQCVDGG